MSSMHPPWLVGLLVVLCSAGLGAAPEPADVSRFMERHAACEHFRGEEAYDTERAKFLERSIRESCSGLEQQLRLLMKKYRNDKVESARLAPYATSAGRR